MKNYYAKGQWNIICDVCGRKVKSGDVRKRWDGAIVCQTDFESRHPLDFIRGRKESLTVPWTSPEPEDVFVGALDPIEVVVAGMDDDAYTAFRWSSVHGVYTLPLPDGYTLTDVTDMTEDGNTILGIVYTEADGDVPILWAWDEGTLTAESTVLTDYPEGYWGKYPDHISTDGTVLVQIGLSHLPVLTALTHDPIDDHLIYTDTPLTLRPTGDYSLSGDGRTVASSKQIIFSAVDPLIRWFYQLAYAETIVGVTLLPPPGQGTGGYNDSWATGVTHDGSSASGYYSRPYTSVFGGELTTLVKKIACRWEDGVGTALPLPSGLVWNDNPAVDDGTTDMWADDIAQRSKAICGTVRAFSPDFKDTAFLWTPESAVSTALDALIPTGSAQALLISPQGRAIAGTAQDTLFDPEVPVLWTDGVIQDMTGTWPGDARAVKVIEIEL